MTSPWLIVADDLTGAADCGIAFAKVGLDTVVAWAASPETQDLAVVSLDADSRRLPPDQAADKQGTLMAACYRPGLSVYKKIDSTLRGHPAEELAIQRQLLGRLRNGRLPLAIVAPAFPGTGRTTEGGRVLVNGVKLEDTPLWARDHSYDSAYLPGILESAGMSAEIVPLELIREGHVHTRAALIGAYRRGINAMVCDAVTESDLATIAKASLAISGDALWVGTGGLAGQIARQIAPRGESPGLADLVQNGPVMVAVGSVSEVSRAQADAIVEAGLAARFDISAETLMEGETGALWQDAQARLTGSLAQGRNVLVEIASSDHPDLSRGPELAALFARFAGPHLHMLGALVATGGDTAYALLSYLEAKGVRLIDEVEAGVPFGVTLGPLALPFISKAGAFGAKDTLARCIVHAKTKLTMTAA